MSSPIWPLPRVEDSLHFHARRYCDAGRRGGADLMKSLGAMLGIALLLAVIAMPALAEDDFPITGTYTENQICKGDGSDASVSRVKIGLKEIESSVFGICTIRNRKRDSSKFHVNVEC